MPVVQVQGLTHRYGARTALADVSFDVSAGAIFGLLGPNGGGKTTLFRILATLFPPSAGTARILGFDVRREAAEVRRRIGVVFQNPSLDAKLTVQENLIHQGRLYGLRGAALRGRIDRMMARLRIADRAGERVETLSGGLKRRVELAKGLLHEPRLLVLDEPSVGLDPGARRDLWDYLLELRAAEGATVLVTTHLIEEADRCDRVLILNEGAVVAVGAPDDLKREIGGDVITLTSAHPQSLSEGIAERFALAPALVNGSVRLERNDGHQFIAQLVEAFPGMISAVTLAKPTLEDVFIARTGHHIWREP